MMSMLLYIYIYIKGCLPLIIGGWTGYLLVCLVYFWMPIQIRTPWLVKIGKNRLDTSGKGIRIVQKTNMENMDTDSIHTTQIHVSTQNSISSAWTGVTHSLREISTETETKQKFKPCGSAKGTHSESMFDRTPALWVVEHMLYTSIHTKPGYTYSCAIITPPVYLNHH